MVEEFTRSDDRLHNEYLKLYFNLKLYFFIVIGCLGGGQYICSNGGYCYNYNEVGICFCPAGYNGPYCNGFTGCNAGGSSNCTNGICIPSTGVCQCATGYTGVTCSTGSFSIYF